MSYTINVNLIPGLPKIPYDSGKGNYLGVVAHATGTTGDTATGERSYESRTFNSGFVHFFVDHTQILQTASTDYICYGSGFTANHSGYVQVELCQTTDASRFTAAFDRYTWLLAKLLHDRKLGVVDGITLMSHAEVSAKWKETDHTDPIGYLSSHGKKWSDVVSEVKKKYDAFDAPITGGKKVKNLVVYDFTNEVDKVPAEKLRKFLKCPVLDSETPFDYSQVEHAYCVGAPHPGGLAFSSAWNVTKFTGADRYATRALVDNFIKANGGTV